MCFVRRIPGRLNDRRTPLGELNWIFTAVTDTIAWNMLPRGIRHEYVLKYYVNGTTIIIINIRNPTVTLEQPLGCFCLLGELQCKLLAQTGFNILQENPNFLL